MRIKILLLILIVSLTGQIIAQDIDTTYFKECYQLFLNENFEKAKECYLENDTSIYAIYNAAFISNKVNDEKRFKKLSKKLISKKMRSADSYKLYADLNVSDSVKYLKILNKGLKVFENDTNLLILKANYYLSIQDFESLIPIADNILSFKKSNKGSIYSARAWAHQMLNDNELALTDYKKAMEIDSLYFEAYFNIAAIYYNQAVDLHDIAYKEPDNTKYYELIQNANREFEKAVPYLVQADKINPNDLTILKALKIIYYRLKLDKEYQEISDRISKIE